ncbi:MAG: YhbY family RNA-binding protein [Phycisphaerales bacterium]|nr:YhbY family RNA-binding protein [Phycisphaerales bacterium]MCB9857238.1 YhbY family RNA-binding protein [Phycisphaerales bacterium]MCB9863048.1 YhbY family RNA-binding protein [Phycisphaerales bacterium]
MTLDAKQRKSLVGRSHPLKPIVYVGRHGVQPEQVATIREHFRNTDLVKVKIDAETREEVEGIAAILVETVPCELVARRGHVAILFSDASATD